MMTRKNTICLWYDGTAMDAAMFYAESFSDSTVGAVLRARATIHRASTVKS
jgi:2-polyprenyl-6-hydroxyphenyl methylase/3-demethylubiquinone-9 3-methyltransferase